MASVGGEKITTTSVVRYDIAKSEGFDETHSESILMEFLSAVSDFAPSFAA